MVTATPPPSQATPEVPIDSDVLYEVIDGQVVEKVMGSRESDIASLLSQFLGTFARTQRLGKVVTEMLFLLDQATKLQRRPDVAFVSNGRWPWNRLVPEGEAWDMVPDLAVEVVSPTNTAAAIKRKIRDYFAAGVRRVWVVYPETQEVEVYDAPTAVRILAAGSELDGAPLLPGFRLPVATLFEEEAG